MIMQKEAILLKVKTAQNLVKEGFQNLVRNRVVSLISISTILLSLVLFSVFYISVITVEDNINNLQGKVEISAFIDNTVDNDRILEIQEEIAAIDGVKSLEHISSEQGYDDYLDSLKKDGDKEMMRILEESTSEEMNPIPVSINISTVDSSKNIEIKKSLESIPEIYKVNDGNLITDFLNKISMYSKIAGTVIMTILSVICVFLIANTIKVAVLMRKKEINIIKYIGATNNYIRLPFIAEGFFIGLIGSVLSLAVVSIMYKTSNVHIINALNSLMDGATVPSLGRIILSLTPITIAFGCGIGVIGSIVSMRKYLKV